MLQLAGSNPSPTGHARPPRYPVFSLSATIDAAAGPAGQQLLGAVPGVAIKDFVLDPLHWERPSTIGNRRGNHRRARDRFPMQKCNLFPSLGTFTCFEIIEYRSHWSMISHSELFLSFFF